METWFYLTVICIYLAIGIPAINIFVFEMLPMSVPDALRDSFESTVERNSEEHHISNLIWGIIAYILWPITVAIALLESIVLYVKFNFFV